MRPEPKQDPAHQAFAKAVVWARKEAGINQTILSKRLGLPNSVVSEMESARRRIDVVELYKIARACDMAPSRLFSKAVEGIIDQEVQAASAEDLLAVA